MRRTSEQVTRDGAEDFGKLLADSRITPSMLAALTQKPDIVYNSWLIRNVRPSIAIQREATKILKALIDIRETSQAPINFRDLAQLRALLRQYEA